MLGSQQRARLYRSIVDSTYVMLGMRHEKKHGFEYLVNVVQQLVAVELRANEVANIVVTEEVERQETVIR